MSEKTSIPDDEFRKLKPNQDIYHVFGEPFTVVSIDFINKSLNGKPMAAGQALVWHSFSNVGKLIFQTGRIVTRSETGTVSVIESRPAASVVTPPPIPALPGPIKQKIIPKKIKIPKTKLQSGYSEFVSEKQIDVSFYHGT